MAIFGLCGFELLMILGERWRVEDGCLCLWVACRFLRESFVAFRLGLYILAFFNYTFCIVLYPTRQE